MRSCCHHCENRVRYVDSTGRDLHEGIVDGDDEDFACVLELCVGDVVGDVRVGAGWTYQIVRDGGPNCTLGGSIEWWELTEGSWHTDDKTLARCELLLEINLFVRGVLSEGNVWDGISGFDHGCSGAVCELKVGL